MSPRDIDVVRYNVMLLVVIDSSVLLLSYLSRGPFCPRLSDRRSCLSLLSTELSLYLVYPWGGTSPPPPPLLWGRNHPAPLGMPYGLQKKQLKILN